MNNTQLNNTMNASEYWGILLQAFYGTNKTRAPKINFDYIRQMREKSTNYDSLDSGWLEAIENAQKNFDTILEHENIHDEHDISEYWLQNYILRPLIETLPSGFKQKAEQLVVGMLPIYNPNAQVIRSPNGEPIVILDSGLMAVLANYSETEMLQPVLLKQYGMDYVNKFIDDRDYRLVRFFLTHGASGLHVPYEYKRNYQSMLLHNAQIIGMETFVVAHEFAHIYANHMSNPKELSLCSVAGNELKIPFFEISQKNEFEADLIGYEWYINSLKNPKSQLGKFPITKIFPLFVFQMLHLVEINSKVDRTQSTHPPARERLSQLVNSISKTLNETELRVASNMLVVCDEMRPFNSI